MKSNYLDTSSNLIWWPELGMGFHPAPPMDYQEDYWQEYLERDASPMGEKLTNARVEFVRSVFDKTVVDIGIGGGRFVKESNSFGFDVNAQAIDWLKKEMRYFNPYDEKVSAITCWDSLEHILEPEKLLNQVKEWLFVSLPIFENAESVIKSRHYKPSEHIWYWTHDGFIKWCEAHGFKLMRVSDIETQLGREGIMTYAFKRDV